MADIALFHPSTGIRPGVLDAAERLRAAGHRVDTIDQYDGRVFDTYDEADAYVEEIGFPELMRRAVEGTAHLPDGFIVAGFSNGAGMAEWVATQRRVSRAVLLSGALPLEMLGVEAWPAGVAAQIHYALEDPRRLQGWIDAVVGSIEAAGAPAETFDYHGSGHLFTDASMPDEYDAEASTLLWERVLAFCAEDAR